MISIILPTYLPENQRYLDLAIESINNLDFPKDQLELVVVASNGFVPIVETTLALNCRLFNEKKTYSEAINLGIEMARGEFYFLISDDVILTKDCLSHLYQIAKDNNAITQAISNCDNTRKYQLMMGFSNQTGFTAVVDTAYYYDHWAPIKNQLMNTKSVYPLGVLFSSWVCFYAVLIPKKVWVDVGSLDEGFRNGQEDVDFCIRARLKGITIVTALNSLIWHFSGKTADSIMTKEMRNKNLDYFEEKWGKPIEEFLR